jgi:Fe2+ or Zn2+ uptake regulation protein
MGHALWRTAMAFGGKATSAYDAEHKQHLICDELGQITEDSWSRQAMIMMIFVINFERGM